MGCQKGMAAREPTWQPGAQTGCTALRGVQVGGAGGTLPRSALCPAGGPLPRGAHLAKEAQALLRGV